MTIPDKLSYSSSHRPRLGHSGAETKDGSQSPPYPLAEAASLAGLPAATEKQVEFIASLMARKNISVAYLASSDMLTKRGASNVIDGLKVIQQGVC